MTVADVPERSRYELREGGELQGWVEYLPAGRSVILAHTEVLEGGEGQGRGSRLVRGVLEDLRDRGVTVIPTCPFAAAYIARHPEWAGVVDESMRARFGG
jgi:predicted GNAT family acetyltransferase